MSNELTISVSTNYGITADPAGGAFGPRRRVDYEFVWIIEGDSEYIVENTVTKAPVGSIVLCRPGHVDSFRWDVRHRTRHGYVHFDIHQMPEHWLSPTEWPLVRMPEPTDIILSLFKHTLRCIGRIDPIQIQYAVSTMLCAFVTGSMSAEELSPGRFPEAVQYAIAYIHRRLEDEPASPMPLADIARVAGVTPEHLCRLFTACTGMGPAETVRKLRLDNGATLLARTNYSVGQVADLVGFANGYHFARRFKIQFNETPSAYRARILSKSPLR
jgi:AraC-like DNA-binding protein